MYRRDIKQHSEKRHKIDRVETQHKQIIYPIGLVIMTTEANNNNTFLYTEGVIVPPDVVRIRIDPSVDVIPGEAFKNCQKFEEVILYEGLIEIGRCAFFRCPSLKHINIPSTVEKIGEYAFVNPDVTFKGCLLEKVELSEGLLEIGNGAFRECASLRHISIPLTVTKIGDHCFHSASLASIGLHDGVELIEQWGFCSCRFTKFRLPPLVTKITGVFSKCENMFSLEVSTSITRIEMWSFAICRSLRNIAFLNNIIS